MCSSSNHELFLETEGAYVAPSVGMILASASPRDESAEAEIFMVSLHKCYQHLSVYSSFISPAPSVSFSLTCSRAVCASSLHSEASV